MTAILGLALFVLGLATSALFFCKGSIKIEIHHTHEDLNPLRDVEYLSEDEMKKLLLDPEDDEALKAIYSDDKEKTVDMVTDITATLTQTEADELYED